MRSLRPGEDPLSPHAWMYRLATTFTTTLATGQSSNLTLSVAASEIWCFQASLLVSCSGSGGTKVAVAAPSGTTLEAFARGHSTALTATTGARMPSMNTLSAVAFDTAATAVPGRVELGGSVVVGTTAGNVTIQIASTTAGQTSSLLAGSTLVIQRAEPI